MVSCLQRQDVLVDKVATFRDLFRNEKLAQIAELAVWVNGRHRATGDCSVSTTTTIPFARYKQLIEISDEFS